MRITILLAMFFFIAWVIGCSDLTQPEPDDPLVGTWHYSQLFVENALETDVVWDSANGVVIWWPYDNPYINTIHPADFLYYFYADGTVKFRAFEPIGTDRDTTFFGGYEGDYRLDGEALHLRPDNWEGHRVFSYEVSENSLFLHGLDPEVVWKLERIIPDRP